MIYIYIMSILYYISVYILAYKSNFDNNGRGCPGTGISLGVSLDLIVVAKSKNCPV